MRRIISLANRHLVTAILIPLIMAGIAAGWVSLKLLTPSLSEMLIRQATSDLVHAADMSLSICEERLDDLLSTRMETDAEVNASMQRQALEEIRHLSKSYANVEVMVFQNRRLVGASIELDPARIDTELFAKGRESVFAAHIGQHSVMASSRYFPFWRWRIVTFIFDRDFKAPLVLARRIVALGITGVLLVIIGSVLALFHFRIYRPLHQLATGAHNAAQGCLRQVKVASRDEIGQVAQAFNSMVSALIKDKEMIRNMMSELRDSEDRYRVLSEHALTHILVIQSYDIVYANRKMMEDLGYSWPTLAKMPSFNLIHPADRRRVVQTINAVFKDKRSGAHFECRLLDKSGRALWFENLATAIVYREKPAVVIHAINIEKRKQEESRRLELEQRLSRSQKMEAIGALAASVAHDLNNILSGLVTYPELLLMDLDPDSPLRQPLAMIQQAGQRAATIVQDMLTLARRGVVDQEVVCLNDIVEQYLSSPEFARLQAEHPRVRLELDLAPDLPNVVCSAVHVSKTIMNLVTNSFESFTDSGTVMVTTGGKKVEKPLEGYEIIAPGNYCVLTVRDNGSGIEPRDLKKIFEPFYTRKIMAHKGTGLGMAVVWSTVKDHDGFIDVASTPGQGTEFRLYFPATDQPKQETLPDTDLEPLRGSETVMVVDDVDQQRMVGRHLLEKLGYTVLEAASGEQALALAAEQTCDLVVLDMLMEPGIDGLETYRRMLEINPCQKAIIASGYSETLRVKKTLDLGAACYVRKPYTIVGLGKAVRRALDGTGPDR